MRFDLGTLDSGERSLPFGLLVKEVIRAGNFLISIAAKQDINKNDVLV